MGITYCILDTVTYMLAPCSCVIRFFWPCSHLLEFKPIDIFFLSRDSVSFQSIWFEWLPPHTASVIFPGLSYCPFNHNSLISIANVPFHLLSDGHIFPWMPCLASLAPWQSLGGLPCSLPSWPPRTECRERQYQAPVITKTAAAPTHAFGASGMSMTN